MFLVEKPILSSPFKSTSKKSNLIKTCQLAAISLDQKISNHLKSITLSPLTSSSSSSITLTYLSNLISFLTSVHTECESQISNVKETGSAADDDEMLGFYMEYSLKVLDLCNLMTSSVQKMTEKRMLINFGVKLLMMNFNGQAVQVEKMNKAKDVISRAVNGLTESSPEYSTEKGKSAKKLIDELTVMIERIPEIKTVKNGRDLVARAFHALGLLTVIIGNILVSILFGETDSVNSVKVRVPAEFMWSDSVNELQKVNGNKVLEVDDMVKQAVIVRDLIDDVEGRVRLAESVKDMEMKVKRFSEGVDTLNNGVNGLFRTVLKTRNGRLDGKC